MALYTPIDPNEFALVNANAHNYYDQQVQARRQQTAKPKSNFAAKLLPSVGGIGGGAAGGAAGGALAGTAILPGIGTAAGGLLGALLGGAAGGAAGKVAENKLEDKSLTSGVGGEALANGVLSAGPLRLVKAATTGVKAARGGASLTEALSAGGQAGKDLSLLRSAGNKANSTGQGLIAKEFRLSPTQQANFAKLHGEEATSVLRRYGVKSPEDVATKIQPLQDAFDGVIAQVPAVGKNDLSAGLKNVYQPLLDSPALFEQGLGGQVKKQADELLKLAKKGSLPADKVNELRKTFDSAVKYTQKGAPEYNVIKKTADALRGTLQTAADKAGVKTVDGMSFKEVGKELRKLYGLDEVVGKQQYLGSGNLPVSLTTLLGAGAGAGAAGGPLGAVGGIAATKLLNSPAGRRVAANSTIKAGEKLTAKAGKLTDPNSLGRVTKRVAPVGLAQALESQSVTNQPTTTASPTTTNPMMNADMIGSQYANPDNMSSDASSPYDVSNIESNVQKILANGGTTKDVEGYLSIASAINDMKASAAKAAETTQAGYSKPTASQYAQGVTALQSIDQLEGLINSDPGLINKNVTPGQGLPIVGSTISNLAGTGQYRALTKNILNSVARINTGANMPASEQQFYEQTYLPQPNDSAATKQQKIQNLRQFFAPIVQYSGGGSSTDLASALGL